MKTTDGMRTLDSLRYNRWLLTKYKGLFKPGIYLVHPNLRSYVRIGVKANDYLPQRSFSWKWLAMYAVSFLYIKIIIHSESPRYDFAYFSNMPEMEERDIKLFSLSRLEVLTICHSPIRYDNIIATKERIEAKYPIPRWYPIYSFTSPAFKEQMINLKNRSRLIGEELFSMLLKFYLDFFIGVHQDKEYHNEGMYYQHGDLSIDNVFIDNAGKICFIDFDHAGFLPPFYDLYFLVVNNYVVNGDVHAIDLICNTNFSSSIYSFNGKSNEYYFKLFVNTFKDRYFYKIGPNAAAKYSNIFKQVLNRLLA